MSISFGSGFIIINDLWPVIRDISLSKSIGFQYVNDTSIVSGAYNIFSIDQKIVYNTVIFKGNIPAVCDVSQSQNDVYKSDWENNYVSSSNLPIDSDLIGGFNDPRVIHRLGNATTSSVAEALVSIRPYVEQSNQAQRSVVSTNANDTNSGGTGAKAVRITYLNSNYIRATEDVNLNGTTAVNTVATDIRFIEDFRVIKGAAAIGAIKLMTLITGSGTEFCGIGASSNEAFLCHHYVPSGSACYVQGWGAVIDDDCSMKLTGQKYYDGNIVDEILDLEKMFGIGTAPGYMSFYRNTVDMKLSEKTYVRVTYVPSQSTSTTVRAFLDVWEVPGNTL